MNDIIRLLPFEFGIPDMPTPEPVSIGQGWLPSPDVDTHDDDNGKPQPCV